MSGVDQPEECPVDTPEAYDHPFCDCFTVPDSATDYATEPEGSDR